MAILHADADAFFVSVARLVDPDGAGKAKLLIVGGRPGSRGVVCSASYEARAFGVRSAMPISRALKLCPDAMCVPVPRECGAKSREIRAALEQWTPIVEGASPDEWYLDMTGTEQLYAGETLRQTAHRIRDAVRKQTSMTISIGGGPSKYIAKLAAERAKPRVDRPGADGVLIVEPEQVREFLDGLLLADIPGVGPKSQARLASLGLVRIADARDWELGALQAAFGPHSGAWLYSRIHGVDMRVVTPRAPRRQMSHERTFSADITDERELRRRLDELARLVAAGIRKEGLRARTITVKLRESDFQTRTAAVTLKSFAQSDRPIVDAARDLFDKLRHGRAKPARLIGVAASGFDAEEPPDQLALFDDDVPLGEVETPRDRNLSRAVDRVREKFGEGAIRVGGTE
ncbi:MAG TPA: DNA polymerase IV [Gemmatimonadaceae bacterium]|nr:DNA polymerase IV [Gemmatimonadaceae bacterium]